MSATPAPRPRVFGLGFHKTGTKSLKAALQRLVYRVAGPNCTTDPDIAANALPMALALAADHDAFQDNPWPLLFREMDERFPGSRFVMTVRAPDAWLASVVGYFGAGDSPMRRWIYGADAGSPIGNEARYLARYEAHLAQVRAHFAERPQDLLEMDLARGDGWEALCGFLGHPVPGVPFPHANRGRRHADADGA